MPKNQAMNSENPPFESNQSVAEWEDYEKNYNIDESKKYITSEFGCSKGAVAKCQKTKNL